MLIRQNNLGNIEIKQSFNKIYSIFWTRFYIYLLSNFRLINNIDIKMRNFIGFSIISNLLLRISNKIDK